MDEAVAEKLLEGLPIIRPGETFSFGCHPGVDCFNACCADLDLVLSPYDVLRLRRGTALSSRELLRRYTRLSHAPGSGFPILYLLMRDDSSKACQFVTTEGCSVYENRPGPCRIYPLGRGAGLDDQGGLFEKYVLVRESHCHGFAQTRNWTIASWSEDQGISEYDRHNDRTMRLMAKLQERAVPLSRSEAGLLFLALYRLDDLREMWGSDSLCAQNNLTPPEEIPADDTELLVLVHEWLATHLLG